MKKLIWVIVLFLKFNLAIASCPPPVVTISTNSTTICAPSSVTLLADIVGDWYMLGNQQPLANNYFYDAYFGATYFIVVTDSSGTDTSNFITLNDVPQPIITGDSVLCANSNIVLFAAPDTFVYVEWSGPNFFTSISPQVSINEAGYYQITAIYDGCSTYASKIVDDVFFNTITFNGSLQLCPGDSVELIAPISTNNYFWNTGQTTQTIFATQNQEYNVLTYSNNCSATQTISVDLLNTPPPIINGNFTICDSLPVTLSVDNNFVSYSWSNGEFTNEISTNISGIYYVSAVDFYGCFQTSETINLTNDTSIAVPTIYPIGSTEFCEGNFAILSGNLYGVWNTNESDTSITVSQTGNYFVTVSNACGTTVSNTINTVQHICLAIEEAESCNPKTIILNNVLEVNNLCNQKFSISIINMQGQIILHKTIVNFVEINLNYLASASYILAIESEDKIIEKRVFVKE